MGQETFSLDMGQFRMANSNVCGSSREVLVTSLKATPNDEMLVIPMDAWQRIKGLAAVNGFTLRSHELTREQGLGFSAALTSGTYVLSDDTLRGICAELADIGTKERGILIQSRQGR